MRRLWIAAALAAAGATSAGAAGPKDYRPAFRPDRLKGPPPGPANDVMVLGTTHLSGLPKSFDPSLLEPLIVRLTNWRPTAIATEDLSGLQCDALRRYPYRYGEGTLDYCPDPTPAGRALGLDVPAANAEAERTLASWGPNPSPTQRRRLAALFLAAGEPNSAVVQWLRLAPAERRAGDGLTQELAASLDKRRSSRNESTAIAAVVAARLGLDRLWSVDDHSADSPNPPDQEKAYEAAVTRAWDNPATKRRAATDERLQAGLGKPDGVLNLYRAYNAPSASDVTYASDFGAAFVEPSSGRYGRQYLGWWEVRNLRMVSNIRDVLARAPGTRLLAIVGASHKGYYEAYLDQMHDVRLIGTDAVLR